MKKVIVVFLSVFVLISAAIVAANYLYPYYVHRSIIGYADEVKEDKISKGNITLCSKIIKDETVNSKYISFYIIDNGSQAVCFECSDGWRLTDLKYLGFEKDSNNILVVSGDIGTYRYVCNGQTWKAETDFNQKTSPDSNFYLINNFNEE